MIVECKVPDWFVEIHTMFMSDKLDHMTFANALIYLVNQGLAFCYEVAQA